MISVYLSSTKGSTLKGRNLLLMEQIHSFRSGLLLKKEAEKKMAEFFPLKVYKVTSWNFYDAACIKQII